MERKRKNENITRTKVNIDGLQKKEIIKKKRKMRKKDVRDIMDGDEKRKTSKKKKGKKEWGREKKGNKIRLA